MNRVKGGVNLENTLKHTVSSMTYKDPFRPHGGLIYKLRNWMQTFFWVRNIENEFVDFKTFYLQDQIPEIYHDLVEAYKRNDKVTLQRSLADPFYQYLTKKSAKRSNPFVDEVKNVKLVQARLYIAEDYYIAESQWAQFTFSINNRAQYAVFERRLTDKLTYLDWKLSLILSEEDFEFIHKKHDFKEAELAKKREKETVDSFEEQMMKKKHVRKELFI